MKHNMRKRIAAFALFMTIGGAIWAGASAENKYYPGPEPKPEEPVVVVTPKPVPKVTPKPQPPAPQNTPKPNTPSKPRPTPVVTKEPEIYTVTVQYLYPDGTPAAVPYHNPFPPGEQFDIFSPEVPGYSRSEDRISGKMQRRNESFVVYYYGDGTVVIEDYGTPLGLGDVIINIGDCYE